MSEANLAKNEENDEVNRRLSKVYEYNYKYAKDYGFYEPVMCGSIDGTDEKPHDNAIVRALNSEYKPNKGVKGEAERTLFIGRLNYKTSEEKLRKTFSKYGSLRNVRLVRDVVTGHSKGYGFVEFKHRSDAKKAHEDAFKLLIDEREVLVEFEHERRLKGWVPRRLGGGFGGFKESGQLRFGGRYKPFGKIFTPAHFHQRLTKSDKKETISKRKDRSRSNSRSKSHKKNKKY